jgi:hypothetical protein
MPNGLREWTPLDDADITLRQVWGVLGLLVERTKVLPTLVTNDQCGLKQAKLRETLTEAVRASETRAGARRFSAFLVVLSSLLSAVLAVGSVLLLRTGG